MTSKDKIAFRQSKAWKQLRKTKRESDCKDALTLKKLSPQFNLHHLDLNPDNYTNISDTDKFMCLNKKSHDTVHFLWTYYRKDPTVIDRLREILERMKEINL